MTGRIFAAGLIMIAALAVAVSPRSAARRLGGLRRPGDAAAAGVGWPGLARAMGGRVLSPHGAPRPRVVAAALVGGLVGAALAGPVAAVVAGAYAAMAVHALLRHRVAQRIRRVRAESLDTVAMLAADLRAGAAPPASRSSGVHSIASGPDHNADIRRRIDAARLVAEETGAPLADLLDRLDTDLRATERARILASAQTAGTWMTAALLAALPFVGLALGAAMGGDPMHILLHTPLGAACALMALALQTAGLTWTARLARPEVPA